MQQVIHGMVPRAGQRASLAKPYPNQIFYYKLFVLTPKARPLKRCRPFQPRQLGTLLPVWSWQLVRIVQI